MGNSGTLRVVPGTLTIGHLRFLEGTLLKNLLDDMLVDMSPELVVEGPLGGRVIGSLRALLVRDEDLEGGNEVGHGDGLVRLPLLVRVDVLDEDEEVVVLALVVDLDLGGFASRHFCGWR